MRRRTLTSVMVPLSAMFRVLVVEPGSGIDFGTSVLVYVFVVTTPCATGGVMGAGPANATTRTNRRKAAVRRESVTKR